MPLLDQFAPPGNLEDLSAAGRQAWSEAVHAIFGKFTGDFQQFIDPTETDVPDDADIAPPVPWGAFPATQRFGTPEERWARVDENRDLQDEYCEWSVERNDAGEVRAVTFTTETPEYYAHLLDVDEDAALGLYEQLLGQRPAPGDLLDAGEYDKNNAFNTRVDGPIIHLRQDSNTLEAAVRLAAEATILRERDGEPVTHAQALVICGRLGNPRRNSDPQIAAAVNNLAAQGRAITLAAPPGLYITGLMTNGIVTRDGTNPKTFWSVERGTAPHIVRARFEIPDELVGGVTVDGRPLRFGSQLAERVGVGLSVVSFPADHQPTRQPCRPRPS